MHPFISELRKVRNELGISMRQLEKDTGLTRTHMTSIEKGMYNISVKSGIILCDYYGIEIDLFLDYKNYMIKLEVEKVSKELEITLQYNM
jgi:transcriptional regulator with XRE-family HTH domain